MMTNERIEVPAAQDLTRHMLAKVVDGELVPHTGSAFAYVVLNAYDAGDSALAQAPLSGDPLYVLVATGQTIERDSPLASNGDGTLKLGDPATEAIIAYAADAASGTTAGQRIVANWK